MTTTTQAIDAQAEHDREREARERPLRLFSYLVAAAAIYVFWTLSPGI